jgi:hypothetical protein
MMMALLRLRVVIRKILLLQSGYKENSASSHSKEDIDDVVGIALSDEIVDVKKSDLGPYTLRNGLSKVI